MSPSERETRSGSGISVQTLLVSSVSAVVATVIVSRFWEQGTLLFTATVPIAVALVSEAIKRPAEKITQVAPLVAAPRRREAHEAPVPEETRRTLPAEDPFDLYGSTERRRAPVTANRWVRVGLVTGLVAFVIGAALVTASELTLGGSVGGGERRTTLLGGSRDRTSDDEQKARTRTTATPEATATPAPGADDPASTATPQATATPAPSATPVPTATPAPTETPPAPTP